MRQILRSLRMWKKRQPICLPSSLLEASCLRELEHKTKPVERINVVYLYWCDGTKRVWRVQRMRLICKYNALHWLLLPLRAAEKISEQLTRKCGPFDFNRAAERFGSSWEMYGPKKTPHFISKNQLLPFPNLAHLLKDQDQGGLCVCLCWQFALSLSWLINVIILPSIIITIITTNLP